MHPQDEARHRVADDRAGEPGAAAQGPQAVCWELCAISGPACGRRWVLGERARIGRNADNEVSLADSDVSRLHAVIERRQDGYWIGDNRSLNGTLVNGVAISAPVRLDTGDTIRIASTEFTVGQSAAGRQVLDPNQTIVLTTGGLERMLWATGFSGWQTPSETRFQHPAAAWELQSRSGSEIGRRWILGDKTRIGRSGENEICLARVDVSRFHAVIDKRGPDYWIADAGSLNGTLVNGVPIRQPVKLTERDIIGITGAEFVFQRSGG